MCICREIQNFEFGKRLGLLSQSALKVVLVFLSEDEDGSGERKASITPPFSLSTFSLLPVSSRRQCRQTSREVREPLLLLHPAEHTLKKNYSIVQGSAKEWSLGCVNSHPAARGSEKRDSRDLGPTYLLADLCSLDDRELLLAGENLETHPTWILL